MSFSPTKHFTDLPPPDTAEPEGEKDPLPLKNKTLNKHLEKEFHYVFQKLQTEPEGEGDASNAVKSPTRQIALVKNITSNLHRKRLVDEFFLLGPVEPLIHDSSISEIIINGRKNIFYEKHGHLLPLEDAFLSDLTFGNCVHRICEEAKMILHLNQLFADGNWRGWRVHIARKPLVNVPYHISFRRHPKKPWTLTKLMEAGFASRQAIEIIAQLVKEKSNLLICGPTSSGKTSVLNACLQKLSWNERIITIEDSDELILPNPFSTKLLTRIATEKHLVPVKQSELVRQSLRMRPDRIVMGEARGAEAKDLLMALATGHRGSMGTLHAQNHKQALWRLEMLVQMGSPAWSVHTIRQMIALGINHLIILDRIPHARNPHSMQRVLKGIYRLSGLESSGFLFETLFSKLEIPENNPSAFEREKYL